MHSEPLEEINKRLEEMYGLNIHGKAKFRVVHADDQLEKRMGTWRDYVDHGENILLREVREVREVYKYPNCLGYFILEKWVELPKIFDDIKNHNGYEILWVFKYDNGDIQELYWRAIKFLIDTTIHGIHETLSDIIDKHKKVERDELEYFMNYMEHNVPYCPVLEGEGVVVKATPEMFKETVGKNIGNPDNIDKL